MSRIFSPISLGRRIAVSFPSASMLIKIGAVLSGIRSDSSVPWLSLVLTMSAIACFRQSSELE
jgi:hypothetical protein